MICLLAFCLLKINYNYSTPQNQVHYLIASALFFSTTSVIESSLMAIIVKTIPEHLNAGYWNSGLLGGCAEMLGRMFGNVSFTIYSLFQGAHYVPFYVYIVDSPFILALVVLIFVFYRRLQKHTEIEVVID